MNIRNLGYGSTQGIYNQPTMDSSVDQEYQRRLKESEDTNYLLELGKQGLEFMDPGVRQALERPDVEWGLTEDEKTKQTARAANWAEMTKSGEGAVNLLSDTWSDMKQLVKAATVSSLHSAPTESDYETSGQKIASMMSKIEKEASTIYAKDGLRGLMDAAGNIVKSQLDQHGYWGVYAAAMPFGSMFKTANLARKATAREKLKTHAEEQVAQAEFDVLHPGLEQPRADYVPRKKRGEKPAQLKLREDLEQVLDIVDNYYPSTEVARKHYKRSLANALVDKGVLPGKFIDSNWSGSRYGPLRKPQPQAAELEKELDSILEKRYGDYRYPIKYVFHKETDATSPHAYSNEFNYAKLRKLEIYQTEKGLDLKQAARDKLQWDREGEQIDKYPIWEGAAPGTGTPTKKFEDIEDVERYQKQLTDTGMLLQDAEFRDTQKYVDALEGKGIKSGVSYTEPLPMPDTHYWDKATAKQRELLEKWSTDLSAQWDQQTAWGKVGSKQTYQDITELARRKTNAIQATLNNRLAQYNKANEFYKAVDFMPADEVNRQLRAIEHGFNIDAFHGTVGDIKVFDIAQYGGASTGARSAKLAYFFSNDPGVSAAYAVKHAAGSEMRPEDPSFNAGYKQLTDQIEGLEADLKELPDLSAERTQLASYVQHLKKLKRQYGGNIMPVKIRLEKPKYVDWGDAHILQAYLKGSELDDPSLIPVAQQFGYRYKHRRMYDMVKEAKKQGHDGLIFRNIVDPGPASDHYVVFDAKNIKSTFAKFEDPRGGDWWSDDTGGLISNFILPVGLTSAGAAFTANIENE